jgi:hypothetical protein
MKRRMPPVQLSLLAGQDASEEEQTAGRSGSQEPQQIEEVAFTEVDAFPPFDAIEHGELFTLSLRTNTSDLTHGLHRFPAKFIPQIPRWALTYLAANGENVLDPFMGSGTTLVEGLRRRGTTIGVDIDPLARLIAHAKTDLPAPARIAELGRELHEGWSGPACTLQPPMPDILQFEHWFSRDAWATLQALLEHIFALPCNDPERGFLLVVFSSILRWVSNADDQSQKTYVSGTRRKQLPDVLDTFWRSFQRALRGLEYLHIARCSDTHVLIDDASDACSLGMASSSIDLIVTSPPYLDSVDYMYNFMLEYFWLGPLLGVKDRKTFNALRRTRLGTKTPQDVPALLPETLHDLIDLQHVPAARRGATIAYFRGMETHFAEAARVLREGGRYVLVVGNSQTITGIMPIHDGLVRLAAVAGLKLEKAFAYRIRRHYMKFPRNGRGGIILIDWVIVLQKAAGASAYPERLPLPWVTLGKQSVAH